MCTQESEIFGRKNIYLKNKNTIVKTRLQKSTVFPPFFDQNGKRFTLIIFYTFLCLVRSTDTMRKP